MHKCLFCWRWGRGYAYHSAGFGAYYACRRHWPTLYHMYKLWVRAIDQNGGSHAPSEGCATAPWPRPWGYKGSHYWAMEQTVASKQDFTR